MLVACTAILALVADPPAAPGAPGVGSAAAPRDSGAAAASNPAPKTMKVPIAGTAIELELVAVPAGREGATLWFGRTEVPWELLDVFVHKLDEGSSTPEADAVTRPSKPYISMDRGFGHHGFPAISVSHRNATEFCRWLSAKTGGAFRLPTRAEWSSACALAAIPADRRLDFAWLRGNADRKSHPVGTRRPDAAGLSDLLGNACEWATDGDAFVVMGGSFRDEATAIDCGRAVPASDDWNASDPQIPRGQWWLADAGFVGFRVVCDAPPKESKP